MEMNKNCLNNLELCYIMARVLSCTDSGSSMHEKKKRKLSVVLLVSIYFRLITVCHVKMAAQSRKLLVLMGCCFYSVIITFQLTFCCCF